MGRRMNIYNIQLLIYILNIVNLMKTNENHKNRKSPEEMLMEIRNLLAQNQPDFKSKEYSQKDIESMLQESFISSQNIKKISNLKPITQQKISQASNILQNQNQSRFIQQYTKQKICSEIFTTPRTNISQEQIEKYQRKRQELIRQREIQEEQQRLKEAKVIQNTQKFKKYESKTLPYLQINQFAMKEGQGKLSYLLNQEAQLSTSSINNKISASQANVQENYLSKSTVTKSAFKQAQQTQQFIQIQDEDETMNQDYIKQQIQHNLYLSLEKSPQIAKIIGHILLRQMEMLTYLNDESNSNRDKMSLQKSQISFNYNKKSVDEEVKETSNMQTVASLTKKYRSKGVILKEMGVRSILKVERPLCIRIVNKMIGKASEFHAKKVCLTENQITWCLDTQEINGESKKVELTIQNIATKVAQKEQGSFFFKQASNVQVVVVEGQNRQLIFQKNYLQGAEVYEQLCILMAKKVYNLNMIVSCMINQVLHEFIYNKKATIFDLSHEFLQSHERYPTKEYRIMIISILSALFAFRPEVTHINLQSCRTNIEENSILYKGFQHLKKVQSITITETKLNQETFLNLTKYLTSLPYLKLNITLSNCMINDKMLTKSKENLLKMTNIEILNISQNQFTLEGFNVICEMCSNQLCKIKELNVNNNHIVNLICVGELIKRAKKLQVLYAENCDLTFEEEELSAFFTLCRYSKLKKLSLLNNDIVNNLHLFENFWESDTPKEINLQLGFFSQKTSKNLQGKLL